MAAALPDSGPAGRLALLEVEDAATTPAQAQPDRTGVGQPGFVQKARAPMATEEFERILSDEREHWLGRCLQEVRAVMARGKEEAAEALLRERLASAGEARALREQLREELREELRERLGAAGAAGAEAAAHGAALREESARTAEAVARLREEVAQAQARAAEDRAEAEALRAEARASLAEAAALRAEAAQRAPAAGDAGEAIRELRASVAQLQSAAAGQEEPVRRLAELSGELSAEVEQAKASAELAHRRLAELEPARADVAELRAQVRCLQEAWPRGAAAEAPGGGLDLTLPCVLRPGCACAPGQACCQQEAVADLQAEVAQLAARCHELAARGEAAAQRTAADLLELAGGLEGLSAAQGEVEQRLGELAGADALRGRGGDSEAQIGSLRRLLQDQRRELAVLSSELGTVRERCAAGSGGSDARWGAVCERLAEIESRLAGTAGSPMASTRAESDQKVDELAETLPTSGSSSPPPPSHRPEEERLPTLLAARGSGAARARGLSPKGSRRLAAQGSVGGLRAASPGGASPVASAQEDALRPALERGAQRSEPVLVSDRLKDSLEGVVNAVQRVLLEEEHQQQRQLELAPAPAGQAAARGPAARLGVPAQAPAAWRVQPVVAARAASPLVRVATAVPAVAPPRRAPGGSVVVAAPRTPLLIRR